MNMKRFLLGWLVVGALLALIRRLFAAAVLAKTPPAKTSFDDLDDYVQRQMDRLHIPGVSFAVVEGDKIVHLRGFGRARPNANGEVPTPRTPFYIGSLTKSFTALAVMQLVEAGKIELDAPVQRYLPWFRVADAQASATMAVRHLLIQTSGLPTWTGEMILADSDESTGAAERQARALSSLRLTRLAGAMFEYSNSNYQLLGLIIEAVSGETYADYVHNHILVPLRMSHTRFPHPAGPMDDLAMGHQFWFGRPMEAPNIPVAYGSMAAGLLISTAEDLTHYLIAQLNGGRYEDAQLLSSAGIAEMHRGATEFGTAGLGPVVEMLTRNMDMGQYGMGWCVDKIGRHAFVWHGGTMPDFGGFMALLPEQKKGVVLLFNACHHWLNPVLTEFGTGATALLIGEEARLQFARVIPWLLRAQLLLPILQIADVVATLRLSHSRGPDAERQPGTGREWRRYFVIPLIFNLLASLLIRPLLGRRRGYLKLYMPDFSLLAAVCGGFSLVWSFLRAGLVIRALRNVSS
jgi:CubicO group peptidase (beta-lactamase class C family)